MCLNRFRQPLGAKLFTLRVLRFGYAVCIKHQHFARLSRRVILMITSVSEHSEGHTATFDEAMVPILIEQNRRIMAGVCISKCLVGGVENAVDGSYKLVSLD